MQSNLVGVCPPVQERLTKQIAVAITEALQPTGVGVVIEATYVPLLSFLLLDVFFVSKLIGCSIAYCQNRFIFPRTPALML